MRLPGLMPALDRDSARQSAAVLSLIGQFQPERFAQRPYRSPHHTASAVALVGGGNPPRPGEISLAHQGILFLDELPEFDRKVLETLREPLESGRIHIARAARHAEFPAEFQLIAAMNPCPCGFLGHGNNKCRCTPDQIARYRGKLSGPFLDRIDRYEGAEEARADFRYQAFTRLFELLQAPGGDRTRAIQVALSDPTTEPLDSALGVKAWGAWQGDGK